MRIDIIAYCIRGRGKTCAVQIILIVLKVTCLFYFERPIILFTRLLILGLVNIDKEYVLLRLTTI